MQRTVSKVRVGEEHIRVKIRIEEDESEKGGMTGTYAMAQLLRTILDNPITLYPNGEPFDRMSMWYDGTHWIVESESVVEKEKKP